MWFDLVEAELLGMVAGGFPGDHNAAPIADRFDSLCACPLTSLMVFLRVAQYIYHFTKLIRTAFSLRDIMAKRSAFFGSG